MGILRRSGRSDDAVRAGDDELEERRISKPPVPSRPQDWLPPEILERPPAASPKPDDKSAREWIPRDLPSPEPDVPQRHRRSNVHEVPAIPRDRLERERERRSSSVNEIPQALRAQQPAPPAPPTAATPTPAADGRINLNTAPVEELVKLTGVGRRAAERIVEYREQHGPFASVQALIKVEGFHAERVKRFLHQVCV